MKKLQTLLYVTSIVVAVGIGMASRSIENPDISGSVPCLLKIDFSGGTCPRKYDVTGTCADTYWVINDARLYKNARSDSTLPKTDDCDGQHSACQTYEQYQFVSCDSE